MMVSYVDTINYDIDQPSKPVVHAIHNINTGPESMDDHTDAHSITTSHTQSDSDADMSDATNTVHSPASHAHTTDMNTVQLNHSNNQSPTNQSCDEHSIQQQVRDDIQRVQQQLIDTSNGINAGTAHLDDTTPHDESTTTSNNSDSSIPTLESNDTNIQSIADAEPLSDDKCHTYTNCGTLIDPLSPHVILPTIPHKRDPLSVQIPSNHSAHNNDTPISSTQTPSTTISLSTTSNKSSRTVLLTARQAANENRKLKGYKYVPVDTVPCTPATIQSTSTPTERPHRQPSKPVSYAAPNEYSTMPSPPSKNKRTSSSNVINHTTHTPLLPTSTPATVKHRKQSSSSPNTSTPTPSIDASLQRLEELQQRLEQLKKLKLAQQGTLSTATPAHTQSSTQQTPVQSKSKSGTKRKSTGPAAPTSTVYTPSPVTPVVTTPILTKTGREVKQRIHELPIVEPTGDLRKIRGTLERLMVHKLGAGVFNQPVNYDDPTQPYYAANYLQILGENNPPADLGSIKQKLMTAQYSTLDQVVRDVRQVWKNAQLYNSIDNWVHQQAIQLSAIFEQDVMKIKQQAIDKENRPKKVAGSNVNKSSPQLYSDDWESQLTDDDMADDVVSQPKPRRSSQLRRVDDDDYDYNDSNDAEKRAMKRRLHELERQVQGKAGRKSTSALGSSNDTIPLSQREKDMLKADIPRLPEDKLPQVVEIIQLSGGELPVDDQGDIEIDIDLLDIPTLRKLQGFVKKILSSRRTPLTSTSTNSPDVNIVYSNQTPQHQQISNNNYNQQSAETNAIAIPQNNSSVDSDDDQTAQYTSGNLGPATGVYDDEDDGDDNTHHLTHRDTEYML